MFLPLALVLAASLHSPVPGHRAQPTVERGQGDSAAVAGLPLVEMPVPGTAPTLAVILSGDGGWASGDKAMAGAFADSGVPVVGLDVPSYLRVRRTPDEAAEDLARILTHYLVAWHTQRVILVGYSHGADIVPFMASRLPDALRQRIALIAMLGPSDHASFEFHFDDIVADVAHEGICRSCPRSRSCAAFPCSACEVKESADPSAPPCPRRWRKSRPGREGTGLPGAADDPRRS